MPSVAKGTRHDLSRALENVAYANAVALGTQYELSRLVCLRTTGVAFDRLESIATTGTSAEARALLDEERALEAIVPQAFEEIKRSRETFSRKDESKIMRALGARGELPAVTAGTPIFDAYTRQRTLLQERRASLQQRLEAELQIAGVNCERHAREVLPSLAVYGSDTFYEDLERLDPDAPDLKPTSFVRKRWRSLATYLQRVCAKNETFSEFGPQAWGYITDQVAGAHIELAPTITRRFAFFETAYTRALINAINNEPDVRPELCPRLNPIGRIEGNVFFFEDSGTSYALEPEDVRLLSRCDGRTPARALDTARLERLAQERVVHWMLEPVGMDSAPLSTLIDDVRRWSDGDAKRRWYPRLLEIEKIAVAFEQQPDPNVRRTLMKAATQALIDAGAEVPQRNRELYAATQPIAEECARDGVVQIGKQSVDRMLRELAPWSDLFRDTYALSCSLAYQELAAAYHTAPRRNGRLTLPAFIAHCEATGLKVTGSYFSDVGARAYAEARAAFEKACVANRDPSAEEWTIGVNECHALRRTHPVPMVHEYSYPSADLQIAARSREAAKAGDLEWIVSELHTERAMTSFSFWWGCTDRDELLAAYQRISHGKPFLQHIGLFTAPAHTSHEPVIHVNPDPTICAVHRAKAEWHYVPPAMAEIVLDEANHDIRVIDSTRTKDLGSFIRMPRMASGFHPFVPLQLSPHTPRLRIGKTIVQRRSWMIDIKELGEKEFDGISCDLVLAVERLRASRGLPRWVYVRPLAGEDRVTAALGRDKDVKPVCLDLESYLSLEIMARWLGSYPALHMVEMSPSPEDMFWVEQDGKRSFELRTLMLPPRL